MHNKPAQVLHFNVIDSESSVLLSCEDTLVLSLVISSGRLETKVPSSAKIIITQADRLDVFAVNKKA